MVETAPPAINMSRHVIGDGNTDAGITAPTTGYLVMHVETGERCEQDQVLADIIDQNGALLCRIAAPNDGYLMMRRREARVLAGDTVLIFAAKDER
jgi:predicted deacylase